MYTQQDYERITVWAVITIIDHLQKTEEIKTQYHETPIQLSVDYSLECEKALLFISTGSNIVFQVILLATQ